MKYLALLFFTTALAAQPIVEFEGETFLVDNHPVQRCLLDDALKQVQTVEQFDSYVLQGGRVGVVHYGENEYGLVSNGTLPGGGPICGWIAWGICKAAGPIAGAVMHHIDKKKHKHDEERIAHGEEPKHQHYHDKKKHGGCFTRHDGIQTMETVGQIGHLVHEGPEGLIDVGLEHGTPFIVDAAGRYVAIGDQLQGSNGDAISATIMMTSQEAQRSGGGFAESVRAAVTCIPWLP